MTQAVEKLMTDWWAGEFAGSESDLADAINLIVRKERAAAYEDAARVADAHHGEHAQPGGGYIQDSCARHPEYERAARNIAAAIRSKKAT